MSRYHLAVAVVGAALLGGASVAASAPDPLTISQPRADAAVRADVPQIDVDVPDGFRSADYMTLTVDGRRVARRLKEQVGPDGEKVYDLGFLPRPAGAKRLTLPLSPMLRAFAADELPGPLSNRYARERLRAPRPFLGQLPPGPHRLRVEAYRFTSSAPELIGEAETTFRLLPARRVLVYETALGAKRIAAGPEGVGPNGGAVVQQGVRPRSFYGVAKLSGKALASRSAGEIAAALRGAVDRACGRRPGTRPTAFCLGSGLVAVDEIGSAYADWTSAEKGRQGRASPAERLDEALRRLNRRSPWGFTYSSRVQLYIAADVTLGLATRRRRFDQLRPALGRAGGVWLQMYRGGDGQGAEAFGPREWRIVPRAAASAVLAGGGEISSVHFLFTRAGGVVRTRGCSFPMDCQWSLAESTPLGRRILANGPGAYRTGEQAVAWRVAYRERFPTD